MCRKNRIDHYVTIEMMQSASLLERKCMEKQYMSCLNTIEVLHTYENVSNIIGS